MMNVRLKEKVHPYLSFAVLLWAVVITTILTFLNHHASEKIEQQQFLFTPQEYRASSQSTVSDGEKNDPSAEEESAEHQSGPRYYR